MDVQLKFYKKEEEGRTWVNKDTFKEFESEYNNSQDDSSLTNTSNVQFGLHINVMHPIDNNIKTTKKEWIPLTTVYGGIDGVKLFIKHRNFETVYAWEDSFNEIISISLNRLYINTQKQHETHFKDIKMYGTLFNYNGLGLDAIKGEIANACVPEYLYKLYNNQDETNPRKRLSTLTMDNILKELNMNKIDEGCSIAQIAKFCMLHKITYYVLNYK